MAQNETARGMILVPVYPTAAMLKAGAVFCEGKSCDLAHEVWRRMIKAWEKQQ